VTILPPFLEMAAPSRHTLRDYLGLGLALAVLAGMAAWSWGRLVEVQIDFGREIYLAWQLANGKRLYADLVYYYGPLSPYLNALAFDLFGTSIQTLMLCNLVIAGLITTVLYLLLLDIGDSFSATVSCCLFALIFSCGNWLGTPSVFNYLCPYSHTATHGLLLGLVSILLAGRVTRAPTPWSAALCGLALGLTFLTKPEPFVAAAVGALIGLGLTAWQHHLTRWRTAGLVAACFASAGMVVLVAFAALCLRMPAQTALLGVLGSWPYLGNQGSTLFHHLIAGLDNIGGNLVLMGWVLSWYGAASLALALALPVSKKRTVLLNFGVLGLLSLAAARSLGGPTVFDGLRPLPLLLSVLAIGVGWQLIRLRNAAGAQRATRLLMLTVLAGVLLGRIILRTSVQDYGFVLAAPATMILVVALLAWLPSWVGVTGRQRLHTGSMLAVAGCYVLVSLMRFNAVYQEHRYPVGGGDDSFLGNERCQFVAPVLGELQRRARPGETLCVLPEGILINYLARIESAFPYDCFIPPTLQMFGEQEMTASLQARAPDYVLLFHRESPEYGAPFFGRDYGRELYAWVRQHYRTVAEVGRNPMAEGGDGLILMVRDSFVSARAEPAGARPACGPEGCRCD
jgi:hypothetical protein